MKFTRTERSETVSYQRYHGLAYVPIEVHPGICKDRFKLLEFSESIFYKIYSNISHQLTLIYGLHSHLTIICYSSKEIKQNIADAKSNRTFSSKVQNSLYLLTELWVRSWSEFVKKNFKDHSKL